jgi:hypothetical protein
MAVIIGADVRDRIAALEKASGEIEQHERLGMVGVAGATGRPLPTRRRFSLRPFACFASQILRALKSWRAKRRAARIRRLRSRR